jgi:hypothetical protein
MTAVASQTGHDNAAAGQSCEKMKFAGETACATNGKSFACKGGAGAFACQFPFRANISQLPDGRGSD